MSEELKHTVNELQRLLKEHDELTAILTSADIQVWAIEISLTNNNSSLNRKLSYSRHSRNRELNQEILRSYLRWEQEQLRKDIRICRLRVKHLSEQAITALRETLAVVEQQNPWLREEDGEEPVRKIQRQPTSLVDPVLPGTNNQEPESFRTLVGTPDSP